MTATVIQVPLTGNKTDIVVTQGVDQASTIDIAISAGNAALIVDENTVNLETITSGLVYVPSLELGDRIIENSGAYSVIPDTSAYSAEMTLDTPRYDINVQEVASPEVITLALIFASGYQIAYIINHPPADKRGSLFVTVANHILSDKLRELIP